MKTKLLIALLFISNLICAQYMGSEEIDPSNLSDWKVDKTEQYTGAYHFGESESESMLYLCYSENIWTAQIRWGEFNEDASQFIFKFKNLTGLRIGVDGSFMSNEYSGKFVKYEPSGSIILGLQIGNPWTEWLEDGIYEIGTSYELEWASQFSGKYTEASYKIIPLENLQKRTTYELQLMRNEIYARYGYIFTKGGKMDDYFKKQDWYYPQNNSIDDFLTEIEKKNIEAILVLEKQ